MVTAFQMSILMGNNIGQLCFICPGGNVDARFEATKNKRCLYIVTNPNVVPHRKGCTDFLLQAEIADGSINEHGYDAYCPYDCQHRNQKLKWICACNWLWSKGVRNNWIHYLVDRAYACGDFWCPVHHDFRTDGLGTWNQAQCAFKTEWANQSESYDTPQ